MTAGLPIDGAILLGAGLLTVGVMVVGFSDRLRLPAALLSLVIGMLVGNDGLGLINVDDFVLVRDVSVIALIVILFEGGLTTKPSALRETGFPALTLATVGVVITGAVTAIGTQLVLQPGWQTATLVGAVVASTDAAVVFALMRRAPLPRRLAGILEVESGANDPIAILLTIGILESISAAPDVGDWLAFGLTQLLGGLVVGAGLGWVGSRLLRVPLRSQGLYPLLAMGLAGVTYAAAASLSASGFLAVYVCGLMVGALVPRHRRVIRTFYASFATGADIVLFLLLGLLVSPARLPSVAIPALAVTAILVLAARPIAVALTLLPFRFTWREQVLLSWAGLRGAVPIVLATFPATAGVEGGQTIFNVVFFVVVTSTLIQGTTVVPLARRLGMTVNHPAWQAVAEALPLDGVDVDLVEVAVTPDLPLAGMRLADMPPPAGMKVTIVVRDDRVMLVSGSSQFLAGDLIILAVDRSQAAVGDATAWAKGELGASPDPTDNLADAPPLDREG